MWEFMSPNPTNHRLSGDCQSKVHSKDRCYPSNAACYLFALKITVGLGMKISAKATASVPLAAWTLLILLSSHVHAAFVSKVTTTTVHHTQNRRQSSNLYAVSLKPAAIPLMDSGQALARCGELLIEFTEKTGRYGGGLSAAGAQIRNAGDCIAQAAASCRFKTAVELVTDELRESATCLLEATVKLSTAKIEEDEDVASLIEPMITHLGGSSVALEAAGAALQQRQSIPIIGQQLVKAGQELESLSLLLTSPAVSDLLECSQKCQRSADQMIKAGYNLQPKDSQVKPTSMGKSWLKGG